MLGFVVLLHVVAAGEVGGRANWGSLLLTGVLLLEEVGGELGGCEGDIGVIGGGVKPGGEGLVVSFIIIRLVVVRLVVSAVLVAVLIVRHPWVGVVVVALSLVSSLISIILIINEAIGNVGEIASGI